MRVTKRRIAVAALLGVVLLVGMAAAVKILRHVPTDVPEAPDYADGASWLCRPGRADPCSAPTTTTVFAPGGVTSVASVAPDPTAPIDCFYLYPTVSRVRDAYSPIIAHEQEIGIARAQLARFGAVCRPFAPLYRQVTLAGLSALFRGDARVTLKVPYADVTAAWRHYLANDNRGRGIVLVGHSQGARLLARLMADEIDGKPLQKRLVAAILPGTAIDVPAGQDLGGTFKHIPLCRSATDTACVIAYSSYPADRPIPAKATFGGTRTPGMRDACVDPQALTGAPALDADIPLKGALRTKLGTDFAAFPGLIKSACRTDGPFTVLAVAVSRDDRAGEPTDAIVARAADYYPKSGFHSLDVNLALGTLVDLVRRKAASFRSPGSTDGP